MNYALNAILPAEPLNLLANPSVNSYYFTSEQEVQRYRDKLWHIWRKVKWCFIKRIGVQYFIQIYRPILFIKIYKISGAINPLVSKDLLIGQDRERVDKVHLRNANTIIIQATGYLDIIEYYPLTLKVKLSNQYQGELCYDRGQLPYLLYYELTVHSLVHLYERTLV